MADKINLCSYVDEYFSQASQIIQKIDKKAVEAMIKILLKTKKCCGRLFILGVGGSAGNASHAVNDFRKIAGIEAYTPTDNVSELTARINDDGWDSAFANWLKISRIDSKDCVFILSVGGGSIKKNISVNLVESLKLAKKAGASIIGIVGRDGGYTAEVADACVVIPIIDDRTITPHTESFQAVVWHLLASHPAMKAFNMKWESVK
jgi:D-sedoheptulose 7-phosphate isomerase